MPLARTTKRNELTPDQAAAAAELEIMQAEVERAFAADRAQIRALAALDDLTPEQARRFDLLAEQHRERKAEQKRDAIEDPLREAAAAAHWDKRAERGVPGFDDPVRRELFVMLGRRDFPLDRAERKAQKKARRSAADAAKKAAQAAERAELDARFSRMREGDEPDVAKPAERRTATAAEVEKPQPARRPVPRVTYIPIQ